MIHSVSSVNGTLGINRLGSVVGSSPRSPTARTSTCSTMVMMLSTMMHTSGEGITRVTRGKR